MNHRDESENTLADPSALIQSVPRGQGSRIRHSRPELGSPSISVFAHVPDVPCRRWLVRSEARGGGIRGPRAAAVARATLPACMQLSHRTHGGPPALLALGLLRRGTCIGASGWGWRIVGFVTLGSWRRSLSPCCLEGGGIQCEGQCTPCRWEGGDFWMVSSMPPRLAFEAGFETPCWFFLDSGGLPFLGGLDLEMCARPRHSAFLRVT